jgi:predicted  nucleic acid-binding Zn-ribbon protein/phage FluMu protein Com
MGQGKKISDPKDKRILEMYLLAGDVQAVISATLHIAQSTVSLKIGKFKTLAAQYGLAAAAEEYDMEDQITLLHDVAAEVKAAGLSVEEAAAGFKMNKLFQKYGVKPENYGDLISACKQLESDGLLPYAVKLKHLESTTGKTSEQLVNHFEDIKKQLPALEKKLQVLQSKVSATEGDLASLENQKKLASDNLEKHLKQVGLTIHRLELVEGLAIALMQGAVSDPDLEQYIKHQKQLNQAGIDISMFTQILDAAKVLTYQDGGKGLLESLSEYKGLSGAITAMKVEVQVLEKQITGLEERVKLKAKIEAEIVGLKTEVAGFQSLVIEVKNKKEEQEKLTADIGNLSAKKIALEQGNATLKTQHDALIADVQAIEKKVANIKEVEKQYDKLVAECAEVEAKVVPLKMKLELFDSFMGLIRESVSSEDLDKMAQTLPYLVADVKKGKHSPKLIRDLVMKELTSGMLRTLRCQFCETTFSVDKPPTSVGYKCPNCGTVRATEVVRDQANILNATLAPKKKAVIIQTVIPVPHSESKDKQT